jgi:hypothetical protein
MGLRAGFYSRHGQRSFRHRLLTQPLIQRIPGALKASEQQPMYESYLVARYRIPTPHKSSRRAA